MASIVLNGRFLWSKSSLFKLFSVVARNGRCYYSEKTNLITTNEAVDFLKKKIHITKVKSKLQKDRLGLLTEFTEKYNQYIPFHNLSILGVTPERRRLPDFDSIRESSLRGEGGPCYPQSVFVNSLLSALGYDSYLVAGRRGKDYPYTNVSVVTKNVHEEGDVYLVDVASDYATFAPIPLHDLPQFYKHAFSEYRVIQRGSEFYRQYKVRTEGFMNRILCPKDHIGWQTLCIIEDIPRNEEFVSKYQEKIYTHAGYGDEWYLLSLRLSIYPQGKAVALKNQTLIIWDEGTERLTMTKLCTNEEINDVIREYYPMLDHIDVAEVLKNWQKEVDAWKLKKKKVSFEDVDDKLHIN